MKTDGIPQGSSASYHGHREIVYGTRNGHYEMATSSGWQDETYAIKMAARELDAQTQVAHEAVEEGEHSPLCCHVLRCRYDETGLTMVAGVWEWQLRRHFRSEVLTKLPVEIL